MRDLAFGWELLAALMLFVTACSDRNVDNDGTVQTNNASLIAGLAGLPQGDADEPGDHAISATDNFQSGSAAWRTSPSGATVDGQAMELDGTAGMACAIYKWSGISRGDRLLQLHPVSASPRGEEVD